MVDIFKTSKFTTEIEKRIYQIGLGLIALFSLLALVFFSPRTALAVLVGGIAGTLNIQWLKRAIDLALLKEKKKAIPATLLKYVLRLILIFFILYGSILISLSLVAFLFGFGVFLIATLIEGIYQTFKLYSR